MFILDIPTKVYFDISIDKVKLPFKNKKALIVSGRSSAKKNGSYDDLINLLKKYEIIWDEFWGVEEDPSAETVEKIVNKLKEIKADFIIGLGGGSPIDAAKAAGVIYKSNCTIEELLSNPKLECIPVIAVNTTSGTGTEVTPYSVLKIKNDYKIGFVNYNIRPIIAIDNPKYTLTIPKNLTITTALDALMHNLEAIISTKTNIFVKTISKEAAKIIFKFLPLTIEEPNNLEYRKQLMYAALLGGLAISYTGTLISHAGSYPFTVNYSIRHGNAVAITSIGMFKIMQQQKVKEFNEILDLINSMDNWIEFLKNLGVTQLIPDYSYNDIKEWVDWLISKQRYMQLTPGQWDRNSLELMYKEILKVKEGVE